MRFLKLALIRCVISAWVPLSLAFAVFIACADGSETIISDSSTADNLIFYRNLLPETIPLPIIPDDNPFTEEKFNLGRHLFYDKQLSREGGMSCASCHKQSLAFSDGRAQALGVTGQMHPRNSQALVNVAYNSSYTWANPSLFSLERQIVIPLFGETPIEHGINDENKEAILETIKSNETYQDLFSQAYPFNSDFVDYEKIVDSLATFVRGLISFSSPYDRFEAGDSNALSASAMRGRSLFFSERLECFHCHGGYNFSDSTRDQAMAFHERPFHNTGLYNVDGLGSYPENNQGIFEVTGKSSDMGKFRAPSLRNIELTAPYMHDGSIETLSDVVDFYSRGGRLLASGVNAGDGKLNPFKDGFIGGFEISESEKTDLINFLKSLTDKNFIQNPLFSDPWKTE